MFCSNCGKELNGNEKFCKFCGNGITYSEKEEVKSITKEVNQNTSGSNEQDNKEDENDCGNMIPDNGKSRFGLVIKVLFGVLAVLLVWWNTNNIGYCDSIIELIKGNCILLCLGFFIIETIEEASTSARNILLFANAEYYGKFVHVNDYDELVDVLNKTGCCNIKSVYYNELGTVSVQGKYDTYTLSIAEENGIKIEHKKRRLKRKNAAEACNIMVSLAKYRNPKSPINAHEIVKRNNWFSKAATVYACIACTLLIVCIALSFVPQSSDYIDYVKKAEFQDTGICYEDAMEKFFSETEWSYFESTDDKKVVQMDAVINYSGEKLLTKLQFVLDLDNGMFEVYAMRIDDVSVPTALMNLFVYYIFESYDDTNIDYWSILYELGIFGDTMFQESTNEYYLLDDFIGKWVDTYSQRCYAEIYKEKDEYVIEISWASSSSEVSYWYFRAYPEEGSLCYTNGEHWLLTYLDSGEVIEEQIYGTGEGFFILSENKMFWEDYQENMGKNMEFEKIE